MSNEKQESTFRITDRRGQPKDEPKPVEPQQQATPPKQETKPQPEQPKKAPSKPKKEYSIDFPNFILSLSTSALMHMGMLEDPEGGETPKNLPAAQQEIDIIEMLKEKTEGNLSPQEAQLMEQVMYELHVRFVEASKTK